MSETNDEPDPEELLQQSGQQRRDETEPTDTGNTSPGLQAAVLDAYERLEQGEKNNISLRDNHLKALVLALESSGELERVAKAANDDLERDAQAQSRSDLMGALARVGLREVAPEVRETMAEGYREHFSKREPDI